MAKWNKKVKVKEHGLNLCKTYFKLLNEKKEDSRFKKHVWRLEGNHENNNILLIFSILGMKSFIRASLMAIVKKIVQNLFAKNRLF